MKNKSEAFFKQQLPNKIREYSFLPSELLRLYIKEFLFVECKNITSIDTMPSASVSLNYILEGSIKMKLKNGTFVDLPNAFAFGIAKGPLHFEFSNYTTLFVIIFNPGMAYSLVKTPINEFFEKFIPVDNFFSIDQTCFRENEFEKNKNYQEIVNTIEKFLIGNSKWSHTDGIIIEAIGKIINMQGVTSIKQLLDELPVSRDSFEKKFRKQVGTSPKQFSKIVRFRNLIEIYQEKTKWTEIALNAGYYDQSHFIKDFKAITGKKPSSFL